MKQPASLQPGERLLPSQGWRNQSLIPATLAAALHLTIISALQGLGGLPAATAPEPTAVTVVTLPPAPPAPEAVAAPEPSAAAAQAEAAPVEPQAAAAAEPDADVPAGAPPDPAPALEPRPSAPAAEKHTTPPRLKLPLRPRRPALVQAVPAAPKLLASPAVEPVAATGDQGRPQASAKPAALPGGSAAETSFEGRLLQAVQAEARRSYPAAARLMGSTGQAAVAFEYRDGSVRVTGLAQSSGFPMLDRAAMAAVQNASYPAPPAELTGRTLAKIVHVKFELTAE